MILHPTEGYIPFVPRDYQSALLDDWEQPARLVLKARQLGFSQAFAAEAYWKARYRPPRRILVVSRGERWAQEFGRYVREFCTPGDLKVDNALSLEWRNGSRLVVEAATKGAGRSFAASDVYCDEFAHARWALQIYQAVRPTVARGGSITIFSSPNGRANVFYQLWSGRLGQSEWKRYRVDWRWLFDDAWAMHERATMTRDGFAAEYACNFIESGGAMFRQSDIDACYRRSGGHVAGHHYVLSGDLAGRGRDATVLQVWDIDERPYRLARQERWTDAGYERFYQTGQGLVDEFAPVDIVLDDTGLGDPMVAEASRRWRRAVRGFTFTAGTKDAALTALGLLLEQHQLWFDDEQLRSELELYSRDDKTLDFTDCVMALAVFAATVQHPEPSRRLQTYSGV